MADKMMRVAGRGNDGKAKALRTNDDGNLRVNTMSDTKQARFSSELDSGETVTLIDTDKEIILHSLICYFTNDLTNQDVMQVRFGARTDSDLYTVLSPNITENYTSFITPRFCVHDPLLETLENEPGSRVIVNRKEWHVKGLNIDLLNRGSKPNKMKFLATYSEVE